jgi:MATE family multidrug resistance protein
MAAPMMASGMGIAYHASDTMYQKPAKTEIHHHTTASHPESLRSAVSWNRHLVIKELVILLRLGAPVMGAHVAGLLMVTLNTVMAGRHSAPAMAAVALGSAIWAPMLVFGLGLLMIIAPMVAQRHETWPAQAIGTFAHQAIWLGQVLGLVYIAAFFHIDVVLRLLHIQPQLHQAVLSYLQALAWGMPGLALFMSLRFVSDGLSKTRAALYFGLFGLALNAAGNALLVYGTWGFPTLGATGCGYGSAVGMLGMGMGFGFYVLLHPDYRPYRIFRQAPWPRLSLLGEIIRHGIPVGISLFCEATLFAGVTMLAGALGIVEVAGHQIAINVASLTFMMPVGFSMAISIRVGQALGSGSWPLMRFRSLLGIMTATALMVLPAGLMLLLPQTIAGWYTQDPAVSRQGTQLLHMAAAMQFADGLQVACSGALRALGDTTAPMGVTVLSYWLVGLPTAYYLGIIHGMGPVGLWYGLITGISTAGLLLLTRLLVQVSGRAPPYHAI